MSWLEALILGILQGLTEFLPVSSSGHLELGKAILGNDQIAEESLIFTVLVHAATVLSTLIVFRKDIWDLAKGALQFRWNEETQYLAKIGLSMIPVIFVYLFLNEEVESLFSGNVVFVGSMLCITGALLLFTAFYRHRERSVGYGHAFFIGIAQAIAVLPGISRSGATISTGLILGVDRKKIARFSFLMVIIPILGATALMVKDIVEQQGAARTDDWHVLLIGFLGAFFSGLLACKWMIGIVQKGRIQYFAIYCFIIGISAILIGWIR